MSVAVYEPKRRFGYILISYSFVLDAVSFRTLMLRPPVIHDFWIIRIQVVDCATLLETGRRNETARKYPQE
jgi:hypothetical protein